MTLLFLVTLTSLVYQVKKLNSLHNTCSAPNYTLTKLATTWSGEHTVVEQLAAKGPDISLRNWKGGNIRLVRMLENQLQINASITVLALLEHLHKVLAAWKKSINATLKLIFKALSNMELDLKLNGGNATSLNSFLPQHVLSTDLEQSNISVRSISSAQFSVSRPQSILLSWTQMW